MSGRREAQVLADARLLGQTSYIYEAGCAVMIDGERTLLTGDWKIDDDGTPAERMLRRRDPRAAVRALRGQARVARALAHRARALAADARQGRRRRGRTRCCASTATRTCAFSTTARSAGGWRESRAAPTPITWSPAGRARPRASPFTCAPAAMTPSRASRSATRSRTSRPRPSVGRFFVVANGPERDEALREALPRFPNATVTEGAMGDGFYEAVVSTLAERGAEPCSLGSIAMAPSTPPSPRRSTSRSCSGSRRRGCR